MSNGCLSDWCIAVHGNTTTKHEMSNGCLSDWCIAVHGNTTKHDSCQVSKVLQFYISLLFSKCGFLPELWLSGKTFASVLQEVRVRTPAAAD